MAKGDVKAFKKSAAIIGITKSPLWAHRYYIPLAKIKELGVTTA